MFAVTLRVYLVDLLITYLAIGSAFAMRSYFINRRRLAMFVIRAVTLELLLWPFLWAARSYRRFLRAGSDAGKKSRAHSEYESQIEEILQLTRSLNDRKQVREILERYVALRSAISETHLAAGGEFEIFAISGHRNGATGTACLFRRNLIKLRQHSLRTADDLIRLLANGRLSLSPTPQAEAKLIAFFEAFDDQASIAKIRQMTEFADFTETNCASAPATSARATAI